MYLTFFLRETGGHKVDKSAKLFLQSLELGLPHPLTCMWVCVPPLLGSGGYTLACSRRGVGGSQFGRDDRRCGTLDIYVLCAKGPGTSLLSPSLSLLLVSLPLSTVSESGCWRREDRRRGIGCGCGWHASGSSTVWNQKMLVDTWHRIFISMQKQYINVAETFIFKFIWYGYSIRWTNNIKGHGCAIRYRYWVCSGRFANQPECWIRMFFYLTDPEPDPDPLDRDADPSIFS